MKHTSWPDIDPKVPVVAVDLAVCTVRGGELQILLIKMKKKPYTGMWALPGGIIHHDESLDEAAVRELSEKTGVRKVYLEQLYTFGAVQRDKTRRAIAAVYFALVNSSGLKLHTTEKYAGVDWFPVRNLPQLAYDHARVIRYALQRLRWKLGYSNIVWSLLPKIFTLTELQAVYEAILAQKLDKRNFRKKVLSLGTLTPVKKLRRSGAHRPAALYRFKKPVPAVEKILRNRN